MAGEIYKKPVAFSVMIGAVVLAGSIATMLYPMLRGDTRTRLENLRPFTPLELAGRDVYQREGCQSCHNHTVPPLRSEVLRHGEHSKADELGHGRPFPSASNRDGPDLAREGGERPDAWQVRHLQNPRAFESESNMPSYAFLAGARLDPAEVEAHYATLASLYPEMTAGGADFEALAQRTEMDALVAYVKWLGHAVAHCPAGLPPDLAATNPLGDSPQAIARGAEVFADKCSTCHRDGGHGVEGTGRGAKEAPAEKRERLPGARSRSPGWR